ncbi:C4-dicarboxylate TRAP transporter substrate-binding protein [Lentibacillus halophilus]|uniref:C4-dicarboxylate TRAP transporter substrate-binding protein n=1 Tax=Lentibacillus halophilus TaxID=295065 RepID=A0ABN0Z9J6_9BACI
MRHVFSKTNLFFSLLLTGILIALTACGGDDTSEASGDAAKNLDFSHFFPSSHFMEEEIKQFSKDLKDKTDGDVSITSYPGASLAEPDKHYDAAATGSVDIALSVHGYTPNQFPLTSVMELPFMSENAVEGSKNLWKIYNEFDEFDDEYAGTKPLWLYTTDPGQLFTVGKQVKSVEDLEGMKIRSPSPETSEWLEALGATPVSMPMNENFEALERGVVDGTIAPWEAVKTWGLDEVVDYATIGNFYSTTMFVVMNQGVWDDLSKKNQEAINELTGKRMAEKTGERFDQFGKDAVKQAKDKGVEIYELSDDELNNWKEYIEPTIQNWIDDVEDRGLPGQKVYDRAVELSNK